jgi:copper(I)-binding protein
MRAPSRGLLPNPEETFIVNTGISRRAGLRAAAALGAWLAWPAAKACEFNSSTLRIIHPWTRATGADATTAVVSMKFDDVLQADRLVRVESPVAAGARIAGALAAEGVDFFIPAGRETLLDEQGSFVLLTGLRWPLEVGRSYPLTLGFEKGGVVNAQLSVDYTRFR